MPTPMRRLLAVTLPLLLLGACRDSPTSLEVPGPEREISDGARGGTPYFFWLPPIVQQQPAYSGTFDTGLAPVVDIFECGDADCVSTTRIATSGVEIPAVRLIQTRG